MGALANTPARDTSHDRPSVEVVVPVHNEVHVLDTSMRRLHGYLDARFPLRWHITIVDNASTDGTWAVAQRLCTELSHTRTVHLDVKGRGRALREVWSASDALVVAYMDVDLSTDLDALLPLVAPLVSGHSDLAVGSRLAHGARAVRGPKRELISRCYNLLLRAVLGMHIRDAQCGFKAARSTTRSEGTHAGLLRGSALLSSSARSQRSWSSRSRGRIADQRSRARASRSRQSCSRRLRGP